LSQIRSELDSRIATLIFVVDAKDQGRVDGHGDEWCELGLEEGVTARDAGVPERLVQYLPGGADERLPGAILAVSWLFADEH
jgi:hypothetical protein